MELPGPYPQAVGTPREETPLQGRPVWIKDASLEIRHAFIKKVYGILCAQLLLTTAIAGCLQAVSQDWMLANQWLMWLSIAMTLVTIIALTCCKSITRIYPVNYIFLFIFTGFEGVMVGFISAMYTWQSVVLAAGIVFLVFLGLTAYAVLTKSDFTGMGIYLMGLMMTLGCFGLILIILGACGVPIHGLMMLYDFIGCIVFVGYIIYDTQLIMGEYGGHQNQFSIDDYVFASLSLYLDIINLFMHILRLVGDRK